MNREAQVENQQILQEVMEGLSRPQKELPAKYFYDKKGSTLFEKITRLDEYYLTDAEREILVNHIGEIADQIGESAVIVELGSGNSQKTRMLLDHLNNLVAYIPVDISEEYLLSVAEKLKEEYPDLIIKPVCADYTQSFQLPDIDSSYSRKIAFYPGSTIGNFKPGEAKVFLEQFASILDPDGGMLIGVDLKKDRSILEAAYNDEEGVTAAFNKNMLLRLNRELDADFNLDQFDHWAFFNEAKGRIEMHLVSQREQTVHLNGESFHFEKGETIHTENSYKYTLEEFDELVSDIYSVERVWTDEHERFSLQYLTKK